MVNVIICDDNEKDRNNVARLVEEFMFKNKIDYKLHIYSDYNKEFSNAMDSKMPFKIYLLDIETPSRSGIDIARQIRKKDLKSVIMFLTGHDELGSIVLKNDIMFLSFINKFDDVKGRLNASLRKALELLEKNSVIRINDRNTVYTIDLADILYITKDSFERKTIIKTDYSKFKINKPLAEISELLDDRFSQTHRACYINNDRVVKIDGTKRIIYFDNSEEIDLLSVKFKKELLK